MYFCIVKYMYLCTGVPYIQVCLCTFICEYRSFSKESIEIMKNY